ncbi:MAG: cytidyltransferase [Flavobacteriaceae bacterium]|nr:cytidyltransferase [Flavobacteriaceae bacterium]|tara:strand:+ start:303 stop:725 length:423 start_codon:yes stop_codon:yes gene_type:complete
MKPKAVIVSGYFNPLHKGHLELFEKAKASGDVLWVIVNSDLQRELKGSKEFMDQKERLVILNALGIVDKALISIDKDKTQCATLADLADKYSINYELYFANGGDQNNDSIPEVKVCKAKDIGLIEGLGDKIQSSSWLLKK